MQAQKISFEYNCSQKWSSMNSVNGNKFCEQCKTSVHNLEEKSHEEIVELMAKHNNRLCGYFYAEQLSPSQEQKSSFQPKLILASLAAWLTFNAPKISAQTNSVTTEQHDSSSANTKIHKYGVVDGNNVCFIDQEPVVKPKKHRKHIITLFRIGGTRVFLSKRFPFIHARRMRAGRMAY